TDPSRERVEEIPAKDLTPRHFLLLPKPAWPAARVIIDVAQLFADVTVTFAIPRTLSPTEVAGIGAATNRGESSRAIGARLGKDPSYIRHVRSKVHRGRWVYQKTQGLIVKDDTVRFTNEHRPGIPRHVQLDKPLARLLGFYCAEGSVTQSKTRPNSFKLAFAFGHGEQLARDEITESLTKLFGVRPQQVRRNTTTAITIGKASLALLFVALCGKGAGGKRVPAQIFTADASIQEAFLEAYLEGDGHVYPRGSPAQRPSRESWPTAWPCSCCGWGVWHRSTSPRSAPRGGSRDEPSTASRSSSASSGIGSVARPRSGTIPAATSSSL